MGQATQARYPSLHLSWRRRSQYAQHKRSSGGFACRNPLSWFVFFGSDLCFLYLFSYIISCRLLSATLKQMYFLEQSVEYLRSGQPPRGGARAKAWPRGGREGERGQGRLRNLSAMSLGGNVGFVGDTGTLAAGILRPAPRRPSCGP